MRVASCIARAENVPPIFAIASPRTRRHRAGSVFTAVEAPLLRASELLLAPLLRAWLLGRGSAALPRLAARTGDLRPFPTLRPRLEIFAAACIYFTLGPRVYFWRARMFSVLAVACSDFSVVNCTASFGHIRR